MAKTNVQLQREYDQRMRANGCVPTTIYVPEEHKAEIRAALKIKTDKYIKDRASRDEL